MGGSQSDPTKNDPALGAAGFSLVEMMVALFVMSLMAGVAILMAPGPERTVRDAARTLAARMLAASGESNVVNRRIALVVTAEGYVFQRLDESGWAPMPGRSAFAFSPWPDGVEPRLQVAEADAPPLRAAEFDPVVGAAPAEIILSGRGANWAVSVDEEGEIHVDPAP